MILEYAEVYRKENRFKFEEEHFRTVARIFRELLRTAYQVKDFEGIRRLVTFGNSYHCPKFGVSQRKRTIFEELRGERFFGDQAFWKYYLYFCIRSTVGECQKHEEER